MDRRNGTTAPELKFVDTLVSQTLTASWQATASQNLVQTGAGQSARLGQKICIHRINIRGNYTLAGNEDTTTAPPSNAYKLLLVLDKQANGAVPNVTTIMTDTDIRSLTVPANEPRFEILYENYTDVNLSAGSGIALTADYAGVVKHFERDLDVHIPIMYSNASATIGAVAGNNLFWIFCAFTSTGTNSMFIRTRINYTDT